MPMKNFLPLLVLLASCTSAIRNEEASIITADTTEAVAEFRPVFTQNKVVEVPEDLLGYWVGDFVPTESQTDYYSGRTKINVSLDSFSGDSVFGHSVIHNNYRTFKGTVQQLSGYHFDLYEPGTEKHDGNFVFSIAAGDSIAQGKWTAYKDIEGKVRKMKLKKAIYRYNPNDTLEIRYVDWNNPIFEYENFNRDSIIKHYGSVREAAIRHFDLDTNAQWTDSMDEQYSTWVVEILQEFDGSNLYTTTDVIYNYNASTDTLTPEIVAEFSKADIYILRNSIFARHGYSFRKKELHTYFGGNSWYVPVHVNIRSDLTPLEKANIKVLLAFEEHAEKYYDYFGR